jgi:hypothetical protein
MILTVVMRYGREVSLLVKNVWLGAHILVVVPAYEWSLIAFGRSILEPFDPDFPNPV